MNKLINSNFWEINEELKNEWLPLKEDNKNIDINSLYIKMPFTWGLKWLDQELWLLDINRLVVVAWEGWSWKTTYTMQQALANADNWIKVCYMSLEMWRASLIKFIAKKKAWIQKQNTIWKEVILSNNQKELFKKEVDKLQSNNNLEIIWYKEHLTQEKFEKELNRLAKEYELIFIDNLWMVWRWAKESELLPILTQIMLKVRQNNNITIVALHHMSKWTEKQTWPRGKNAIRGSWKILDDADKIITIARTELWNSFAIVKDRDEWIITNINLIFDNWEFKLDIF